MPDPTGRISHVPDMHRGFSWKPACRVATTANITISTALNSGDTIDGVTLADGDRVLVKNQSTASQNGIYIVGATPTRAADMDQDQTSSVPAEEVLGAMVWVYAGTANAGTFWYTTNTTTPTLGSTSINWSQFSGGGGGSFGTPALTLSTSNSAGAASTGIRTDATIAIFDATAPVTQALGDSAATGSAAFAARRDHKHGMPALSSATPLVESGAGSAGTGTLSSRDDHVHPASGGGGSGSLLACTSYYPSSAADYSISGSSFADVDATNLSVTFTAPASGNVLVVLEGTCKGAAGFMSWGVRESTSDIGQDILSSVSGTIVRATTSHKITGISGGSHTYKAAARIGGAGGTGHIYADQLGDGPFLLTVYALP